MVVKQVFDHSLRAYGKRFLRSLKASNRYSEGYLASLETTVAMAALYAEEHGWPDVQEITTEHLEDYLAYLQDRVRWFGERTYAEPRKLSKGHINAQYRRLNRFFNWLVERGPLVENPMLSISAPKLEEKTVPVITEDQMRDLLTLTDPSLARTPAHRFRLVRDRALLYAFWDTPGRLAEIAKLRIDDVDLADCTLLVMGKGRKERRMPIGDAARSVMSDYLQERETLMPRAKALWVSEQGKTSTAQWDLPDPEAIGEAGQHRGHASPQVPSFLCHQRPAGRDAGAGSEDNWRVEEDSRDLFPDVGGRGRQGVSPAGQPWGQAGEDDVCGKDMAAGPEAREALDFSPHELRNYLKTIRSH